MRIAMVSEHASPLPALGGLQGGEQGLHVAELSKALARRGHEVVVYTRRDNPTLPARVMALPNVEVVHLDAGPAESVPKDDHLPYRDALAEGIAADWKSQPPDVVHGHFWMSGVAALDAAKVARSASHPLPILQTFHALGNVRRRYEGAADTSPTERSWLEPAVARHVDRIVATCPDEVRQLAALGADMARISVAPSGVDLTRFDAYGPTEATGSRRRIAVIGRLVPRTGVDLSIRALQRLAASGVDDVELHVVGGGPMSGAQEDDSEALRLRGLAAELGVADRVVFRGRLPRDAMPSFLRSATAVVCMPQFEQFGRTPLEAMACRVPVVVAAVGGLQDLVVDGVTGLLVRPREEKALAAVLRRLLDDPALCGRLGLGGRRRVEGSYSWDHVAALTEGAYLDTLVAAGMSLRSLLPAAPFGRG